jgi:pimeloyl-ACP methyl ester carboxylesterase
VEKLFDIGFELQQSGLLSAQSEKPLTLETQDLSISANHESRLIDHVQAALNALFGDYLNQRQNALDIGMSFRLAGKSLPIAREALKQKIHEPKGKIVIFIHGLAVTERAWNISAEEFYDDPSINFGSMLSDDLGYTPFYVRYNTGRHTSENGQLLSALLTQLIAEYPGNVEEIVLIGHSMGGLVARSAAHYGSSNNEPWIQQLRHIFCLGSPSLGAPLEKGANILSSLLGAFDTAGAQVPAEILNARSAGIKDLRFGYTIEDEWSDENPDGFLEDNRHDAPLLDGVGYYSIAATVTHNPKHPMGILLGDLLVRLPSAAGQAPEPTRRIPFHSGQILSGMTHLHMANHPEVYHVIRQNLLC